ncbi:chemotaxis protein CheR [Aliidongia dinghuensis]|uniref:Chemotaxis protein methyltransferase n=1 Tax=Aliidongia dinghuensis TaxID=1867774 RepID=A0A8J2YX72_9PROT|nr:protein-glutamate O-methyltransferase [Aliidongia dinghuensis]GGF35323.1 chemotaxis protein CheR [Aliidongia dinghuensis]
MNIDDFNLLSKLIKDRSGLTLTKDKAYLLESRLLPVARKWNLKSLDELVMRLRTRSEAGLVRDVVEAMTTNESFFFRDIKPFDQFKQVVLPYLLQSRAQTRTIKIWSAACSSGQEPYTLAMMLKEERQKLIGWNIDILATDLSTEILAKAQAGLYSQFEVQRGLPIQLLVKYFKQAGDRWQIDSSIREMVRYRPFNLLDDLAGLGQFDVIFCRNVLIYFDQPTKQMVLERMAKQLASDGFLYLGGAETVVGITDKFQPMVNHRGIYHHGNATAAAKVAGL